jgi:hypothetical protein
MDTADVSRSAETAAPVLITWYQMVPPVKADAQVRPRRKGIKPRLTITAVHAALMTMAILVQATQAAALVSGTIPGRVLSGNIPIAGATVELYGTVTTCTPDPCRGTSMAVAKTQTDSRGNFAIDFSKASVQVPMPVRSLFNGQPKFGTTMETERPAPGSLYFIASGGNIGRGSNAAIKLILALGDITGLRHVTINEITTVVTTFVDARRMAEEGRGLLLRDGSPMAHALVDPESATLRPIFSQGVNSQALVNTLADVVAACVRSSGPKSRACSALFAAAPPVDRPRVPYPRTPVPADTISALENIALWPQRNVARIFALLPPHPPYMPILARAPREFMISLNLALGGLKHPSGIAFDPDSNAMWVANQGGDSVTELGAGANNFVEPISGPGGLTGGGLSAPTAIRFVPISPPDTGHGPLGPPTPSLWVANRGGDSLTEIMLSPPGHPSLRRITGNGLKAPVDLVEIDGENYTNAGVHMFQFIAVANSGADVVSLFRSTDCHAELLSGLMG